MPASKLFLKRVRFFYKFETPRILNVSQELTFNNSTTKIIGRIKINLQHTREFLHVYDSDKTILEYEIIDRDAKNNKFIVIIIFPRDKKIHPNELRTVTIDYYSEAEKNHLPQKFLLDKNNENINCVIKHDENCEYLRYGTEKKHMSVPTGEKVLINLKLRNVDTYIFIKKCDGYLFNYSYWVNGQENRRIKNNLRVDERETYLHIQSDNYVLFNNTLFIEIDHFIHKSLSGDLFSWNNIGLYMGILTFITVIIMNLTTLANIVYSVALVTIVISTMIFIKEWLLLKNLDTDQIYQYDLLYRQVVIALFVEITALFIINAL